MSRVKVLGLLLAAFVVLGTAGCGDDDSGGIPGPGHGVQPSKPANQLTQEEINAIADDIPNRYIEVASPLSGGNYSTQEACNSAGFFAGVTTGQSVQVCESIKNLCLQSPQAFVSNFQLDAGAIAVRYPTTAELANCTITVSEIDQCINARLAAEERTVNDIIALYNKYKSYTCNDVSTVDPATFGMSADAGSGAIPTYPECETMYQKCTALRLYW